jgi:hypothetical protein
MTDLIRGRFHPNLHPVLRIVRNGPRCRSDGPWFVDEEGEEVSFGCSRPAGHTGRHFTWEWDGDGQTVHVWTDAESSGYVSDGREGQP